MDDIRFNWLQPVNAALCHCASIPMSELVLDHMNGLLGQPEEIWPIKDLNSQRPDE